MSVEKLKGVNLGGWLVLERWITPSLFDGKKAEDEYTFVSEHGRKANSILQKHYKTFITAEDFKWMADNGLNAVRIPVGYWIFGDEPPFVGNIKYLDFAMEQADKHKLEVIIDFHAAPGSQNGWQHSGKKDHIRWPEDKNIKKSLEIIERLAKRYRTSANLFGIELINEPHWTIKQRVLDDYYAKGYKLVRQHCGDDVAVIFSDAFRPKDWKNSFNNGYKNIYLDIHFYEVLSKLKKATSVTWRHKIYRLERRWASVIENVQSEIPVIVGEWSAAFSYKNTVMDEKVLERFVLSQAKAFVGAAGWFYWTYKTENRQKWSLRKCIENGWLEIN